MLSAGSFADRFTIGPAAADWHSGVVPDDQDYEDLARLLEHPEAWTAAEVKLAHFILVQQQDALAAAHPLDARRREGLARVAAAVEEALARAPREGLTGSRTRSYAGA